MTVGGRPVVENQASSALELQLVLESSALAVARLQKVLGSRAFGLQKVVGS